jgi:hypothetical protein
MPAARPRIVALVLAATLVSSLAQGSIVQASPRRPVLFTPRLVRDVLAGSDRMRPKPPEQGDTTVEPSIAVDPENERNAVAVYQEGRVDSGGDQDNGFATTFDGGRTWHFGELPGLTWDVGGHFDRASDAVVAFGPGNVVYANSLVFDDGSESGGALRSGLAVNVSHDGGRGHVQLLHRQTKKWAKPVVVPTPPGDALWPWIVAGDDGRVALVWYQSLAAAPERWYIYEAYTLNGHGTRVRCGGRSRMAPPSFRVTNASGRLVHAKPICLLGTACLAAPNPIDSDRRLGDFFTVNFDLQGHVFIASGDTMLTNPFGGPKPVSNPIFIRQESGPSLLIRPIRARPTRPLCPFRVFPEVDCEPGID